MQRPHSSKQAQANKTQVADFPRFDMVYLAWVQSMLRVCLVLLILLRYMVGVRRRNWARDLGRRCSEGATWGVT